MVPPTSNRQQMHQTQEFPTERRNPQNKNNWTVSGLYERSQKRRQEKEHKMEALRMEMLEDYTFTPQISLLAKPVPRSLNPSLTTKSASSGESVFSRLYRGGSPKSATSSSQSKIINSMPIAKFNSTHDESGRFRADLGACYRLEEAYQKGVEKMRARPTSETHEKLLRICNVENREMEECTFWPKTNWGMATNKECITTRRSTKLVMKPSAAARPVRRIQPQYRAASKAIIIPDLKREEPPLPKEIIVTRSHPWDSPMRHQSSHPTLLQAPVSPLRELSLVQTMVLNQTKKSAPYTNLQKRARARDTHAKKSISSAHKEVSPSPEYGSI